MALGYQGAQRVETGLALRMARGKAGPLRLVGLSEPTLEEPDQPPDPLGDLGQWHAGLRIEARVFDPERDPLRDLCRVLRPRLRGNVLDRLLPFRTPDSGCIGHLLRQAPPCEAGERTHRMGEELDQRVAVQRRPQQFGDQGQHLQRGPERAGLLQAVARLPLRGKVGVEQRSVRSGDQQGVGRSKARSHPVRRQGAGFRLHHEDRAIILPGQRIQALACGCAFEALLQRPQKAGSVPGCRRCVPDRQGLQHGLPARRKNVDGIDRAHRLDVRSPDLQRGLDRFKALGQIGCNRNTGTLLDGGEVTQARWGVRREGVFPARARAQMQRPVVTPAQQAGGRAERIERETAVVEPRRCVERREAVPVLDDPDRGRRMRRRQAELRFQNAEQPLRTHHRLAETVGRWLPALAIQVQAKGDALCDRGSGVLHSAWMSV